MLDSLAGHFLVASPHLTDGNFYKSVVLILSHNAEGAFGLIINRPTCENARSVMEMMIEDADVKHDGPIYCGGPVDGPLVAIHDRCGIGEVTDIEDVYWASSQGDIKLLLEMKSLQMKLFDGYAGWGPGQLDDEIRLGGWLSMPASKCDIFSDDDSLWDRVVRQIGRDIVAAGVGLAKISGSPDWN